MMRVADHPHRVLPVQYSVDVLLQEFPQHDDPPVGVTQCLLCAIHDRALGLPDEMVLGGDLPVGCIEIQRRVGIEGVGGFLERRQVFDDRVFHLDSFYRVVLGDMTHAIGSSACPFLQTLPSANDDHERVLIVNRCPEPPGGKVRRPIERVLVHRTVLPETPLHDAVRSFVKVEGLNIVRVAPGRIGRHQPRFRILVKELQMSGV